MENNKENTCGCTTGCAGCGCGAGKYGMMLPGCSHKHKIMKKLLLLIIFIVIFNLGVKIGELKGMLRMSMNHNRNNTMMYANDYGAPEIGGYDQGAVN